MDGVQLTGRFTDKDGQKKAIVQTLLKMLKLNVHICTFAVRVMIMIT